VLLSLATGACGSRQPGDVVVADALLDNYFLACELRSSVSDIASAVLWAIIGAS